MCKIFGPIYFTLLIFPIIVECNDMEDKPVIEQMDVKLAKLEKHKQKLTVKDVENKTVNDAVDSNTGTTEYFQKNDQERKNYIKIKSTEEPNANTTIITEDSVSRSGHHISSDKSDSYDYSYYIENDDKDEIKGKIESSTESGEVLIYTPNSKTLSLDAVLDLKARTGKVESEEIRLKIDLEKPVENVSKTNSFSPHNMNMRSGYIPPEYDDEIRKPSHYQHVEISTHDRLNFSHNNRPISTRPEMMHLPNSPPRLSPRFNSFGSREIFYPNSNIREITRDPGNDFGQQTMKSPYFGAVHPSSQLFNSKIHDRCPTCIQGIVSSQERTFRSVEVDLTTFRTANGRLIEFKPEDGNAYPLIPIHHSKEVQQIHSFPYQNLFGASRHVLNSQEHEIRHKSQTHQSNLGSTSKILLALPSYTIKNPLLLNKRIGLGGLQRLILSK